MVVRRVRDILMSPSIILHTKRTGDLYIAY